MIIHRFSREGRKYGQIPSFTQKITSEIDVAPRCTLLTLFTLFSLFILFKLLYTAEIVTCTPIYIVREALVAGTWTETH